MFSRTEQKEIGIHYMINDGLTELAANAVEVVVDERTGIAYAVYLSSEAAIGESSDLVKLAKFNILQPTHVQWVTVFDRTVDFAGHILSECNLLQLNGDTVRVFVIDRVTQTYYYKDVEKRSLRVGNAHEVKLRVSEDSDEIALNMQNVNAYLDAEDAAPLKSLNMITEMIQVDGWFYSILCGHATNSAVFVKSKDGAVWSVQSILRHKVNFEAMLTWHNAKFWVMCRNGSEKATEETWQNLLYSEDGKTWTQSNLALTVSDTRPYLFVYQEELYLAYSSPLPDSFSTVRPWRCNLHVGKIISEDGAERFEELIYKESVFGIVYYSLLDWRGKMIMLYSSGELHPTEGLMRGWSQGKDCLNYTVLHEQVPKLAIG